MIVGEEKGEDVILLIATEIDDSQMHFFEFTQSAVCIRPKSQHFLVKLTGQLITDALLDLN